jgi:hypothetical protein
VNREEAKEILILYRQHEPAEAPDPLIIEALALAQRDPELARWLEMHCARQFVLREKFRQIPVPAGLKEQIISEHAASRRALPHRRQLVLTAALVIVMVFTLVAFRLNHRPSPEDTLPVFESQMAGVALRGYAMDFLSDDAGKIQEYLKSKNAPADYVLPAPLALAARSGCAVEGWQDKKVSMICFRTGRPLAPGTASDLWLFVVDQKSVKDAPGGSAPRLATVNRLITATWTHDGKLYLLGLEGGPDELRKFL